MGYLFPLIRFVISGDGLGKGRQTVPAVVLARSAVVVGAGTLGEGRGDGGASWGRDGNGVGEDGGEEGGEAEDDGGELHGCWFGGLSLEVVV
jgi:hypothetical protein